MSRDSDNEREATVREGERHNERGKCRRERGTSEKERVPARERERERLMREERWDDAVFLVLVEFF